RRFGDVVAVADVSFDVADGTILGIIGPSGSGKTTTVRVLTGGLAPTAGRVSVLGEDPRRFRQRTRERIGYMPQQFVLYPDLTTRENVDLMASLFGLLWPRRRRRVRQTLELLELWPARGRLARDLSGGMQRRLELAAALVHEPQLLFLDEPTAGIDPLLRQVIWGELHRLRGLGRTIVVTTQYVTEAEECDTVALIERGRLIGYGPPEQLREAALGGHVLEIETRRTFDGEALTDLPVVREVRQVGLRNIHVVVDDAGAATPILVEAVDRAGGELVSAREYRPTFEDVFAALVARARAERPEPSPDGVEPSADEIESPPAGGARREPGRIEPERIEPERIEPERIDAERAEPEQTEPEQADPERAGGWAGRPAGDAGRPGSLPDEPEAAR
ncbi:MAG TPA: ATP-binding cassette domain-containing protein, partial [Candidatus Limnocylindrales bacterium]|nr:ATP-binding cassette domain-containing protein [Candidatus Limnocylindrales bacterium]